MEYVTKKQGKEFAASLYQVMIADREYLEDAWAAMDEDYFGQIGISDAQIEEFRNKALSDM